MYVKVDDGLTQCFKTTMGVKQGCIFSPLLFNLYVNKLPEIYDDDCNPVFVNGKAVHCLMWADDCVVMSTSETGLQRSINKTVDHFSELGLTVNSKKTKVMIFNANGFGPAKFPKLKFYINERVLENADKYTYLGLVFTPSGSVTAAANELLTKANRAYFSMSNIFYENKSMKVDQSLKLFSSLICPIAQYASEFWSVLSIPLKSFNSKNDLMKAWENFIPETLNQRFCRLTLSVHKKTSRLAVLGELGQYPLLVTSFIQTLKYKFSLCSNSQDKNSLVNDV